MNENFLRILNKYDGILTTAQAESEGISKMTLKKLVDNRDIERVRRGVYIDKSRFTDEFYLFQLTYPNTVFSNNTALYFYNMTERTPIKMDITIYTGYNPHRFKDLVYVHRIKKELLYLGATDIKSPQGKIVKAYNLERTVCDVIKSKKYIDLETANKAIKQCIRSKDFDGNKMFEYAKKLKIYDKVKQYVEAII